MSVDDKRQDSGGTESKATESTSRLPTRRRFLAGATGAVALTGLAGCSGGDGGGGDGGGSDGSTSDTEAASELSVAAVEGSGRLFQRLMDNYVIDDTGIEVNVELFPYANLFEKISSVLSTQGTAYDIMFMDDPWFPQFAPDVDPLLQWLPEDLPTDQLIETTTDIATWPTPGAPTVPSAEGMEQQIRGQVVVGNTQLFAYNRSYYEEVGADAPPETWADVHEAGQMITEQIDGAFGYNIRGKRGNPAMANFYALGNAVGGVMFDQDWQYQWSGEDGTEAVRFWAEDLKSISPDGVTSFDSDAILSSLADGSAAQAPAWPSAASLLLDPEESDQADNIEFTVIPAGHTGAERQAPTQGNWIMGINSYIGDGKKEAAGNVIRSAISKEAQETYVDLGGVPFRHDTFEDNMDQQPWFEALYESLQTAQWRPRTPLYSEFGINHGQLLNSALAGNLAPSEMTQQAKEDVESVLDDAGYYG